MFKIEYEVGYTVPSYSVHKLEKRGWFSKVWDRKASFATEEEAKAAVEILQNFPKYF